MPVIRMSDRSGLKTGRESRRSAHMDGCKPLFPAGGDVSTNLIREFDESSQLAGGNADYVESLFDAWLAAPSDVPAGWTDFFDTIKDLEAGDVPQTPAVARSSGANEQ